MQWVKVQIGRGRERSEVWPGHRRRRWRGGSPREWGERWLRHSHPRRCKLSGFCSPKIWGSPFGSLVELRNMISVDRDRIQLLRSRRSEICRPATVRGRERERKLKVVVSMLFSCVGLKVKRVERVSCWCWACGICFEMEATPRTLFKTSMTAWSL